MVYKDFNKQYTVKYTYYFCKNKRFNTSDYTVKLINPEYYCRMALHASTKKKEFYKKISKYYTVKTTVMMELKILTFYMEGGLISPIDVPLTWHDRPAWYGRGIWYAPPCKPLYQTLTIEFTVQSSLIYENNIIPQTFFSLNYHRVKVYALKSYGLGVMGTPIFYATQIRWESQMFEIIYKNKLRPIPLFFPLYWFYLNQENFTQLAFIYNSIFKKHFEIDYNRINVDNNNNNISFNKWITNVMYVLIKINPSHIMLKYNVDKNNKQLHNLYYFFTLALNYNKNVENIKHLMKEVKTIFHCDNLQQLALGIKDLCLQYFPLNIRINKFIALLSTMKTTTILELEDHNIYIVYLEEFIDEIIINKNLFLKANAAFSLKHQINIIFIFFSFIHILMLLKYKDISNIKKEIDEGFVNFFYFLNTKDNA